MVYPVGRGSSQALTLLALWCTGALGVAFLGQAGREIDWRLLSAWLLLLLAAVAAYLGWRNSPVGQLAWDGQSWRWESPGYQAGVAEQNLSVVADFQHVLLLRLENQAKASMWLWTERHALPERWMDLRRAVYTPQRTSEQASPVAAAEHPKS